RLFAVRLHRPKPDAGLRNAGADCGRGACDLLRRSASGHFAAELAGPMDRPHQLLALSRPLAHPRVRAIHIDARPDETRGRSGFLCLRSRRLADVRVGGNAIPAAGWPRLQNQLSAPPCGDGDGGHPPDLCWNDSCVLGMALASGRPRSIGKLARSVELSSALLWRRRLQGALLRDLTRRSAKDLRDRRLARLCLFSGPKASVPEYRLHL